MAGLSALDTTELNGTPLEQPAAYENEEPNACLLDSFEYALDDDAYAPCTELLRMDNLLRQRLGYHLRQESVVQPYISHRDERPHMLHLRRRLWSDAAIANCTLALEELAYCTIRLNGEDVPPNACGSYVYEAIQTVRLPEIRAGENVLEISMRFGEKTNLEWVYLLGEFGVELRGDQVKLTAKPEKLFWRLFAPGLPVLHRQHDLSCCAPGRCGEADSAGVVFLRRACPVGRG